MHLLALIVIAVYFIPAIVAVSRGCRHSAGIFILDLFLGWTLIGWVGALVWAVSDAAECRTTLIDRVRDSAVVLDEEMVRSEGEKDRRGLIIAIAVLVPLALIALVCSMWRF